MTKKIKISISAVTVFNPENYSKASLARLESLLDALDVVVADRKKYLNAGRTKALKAFLKDPSACVFPMITLLR
ncbi:MAG: hypothetical protein LRY36_01245 [Alphaproteobacteria bacterium]|nr:hypothetical protein [Alphaproteobacteria bacterium]